MTIHRIAQCRGALALLAGVAFAISSTAALAQIRIASYNTENNSNATPNPGLLNVLQGIGDESVGGRTRRLSIVALTEQNNVSGNNTTQQILNLMNTMPGGATYARGTKVSLGSLNPNTDSSGVIYDTAQVSLVEEFAFGTISSSAMPRQEIRYRFRPVGYDASADFYVYVGHWKASGTASDMNRRNIEAQAIRADVNNNLPVGSRVIYAGDMNLTGGTSEAAWQTITGAGNGQGIDPMNSSWANVAQTWSTSDLGSRLDFQLQTAPTVDSHGFSLINGTYHTFGNNGSTGGAANSGANTALAGHPNRTTVLNSLVTASDHYPVVADYRFPAKVGLSVPSLPARVIVGASVAASATVTNAAPVTNAGAADTLDYTVSTTGALSGSGNAANLAAASAGNAYSLPLDTATPGVKSGTVSVATTSQEAGSSPVTANVNVSVLEHAHPVLSRQTINFDAVAMSNGGAPNVRTASLFLANTLGANITAGLDLDSINAAGATNVITTNAAPFMNLPAGAGTSSNQPFNVSITGSHKGFFTATYTFNVSDENLPGAINLTPLTLTVTGRIAPAGDVDFSGDVTLGDFAIVDGNNGAAFSQRWGNGDFNGDGAVDFVDFAMMDEIYVLQTDGGGLNGTMARAIRYLDGSDRNVVVMSTPELQRVVQDFDRFGDAYATQFLASVPEPTLAAPAVLLLLSATSRRRHVTAGSKRK